ncbi:GntR family transcriptional regulator/MocR family aminotransferase [Luteimonas cucumeris]|uniref:GntR family transcriptional regulator/MocR family aminotransferase n=1 Tax=Luteimonas cucumeris TaxID=985012 RepID=A0A562L4U6_9GAMM|nr:PLP-dependent aminotransferase family protein [Luteimonas cucumeris]TWI02661.1 GntR family transcriptional regulator/MocR family aminotransferase [Luteimonas cucumeris]
MYLELDGSGPLHSQLTRALKATLLTGNVHVGARLPPTRLLARELGVSRNTVLAAYEQLRAEGFLDGRVGSGSYVTPPARTAQQGTARPAWVEPQSAYARRLRAIHNPHVIPGMNADVVRYGFQYGEPLTNPALSTAWARELSHAAAYTRPGYTRTQGLPALREAVCDYLARRRGVQTRPEDVLIVAGTQQALSLTARVLVDPGTDVAIEEPQYFAARKVMQINGAQLWPIPVDEQGLVTDELPACPPRLVCVTPSHQFPSGAVMSMSRRLALLDYAERRDCWVLEDDYDGEFRYDSKPIPALRSLDVHDRVIYVGTFSKVLFPALRLGYLIMPAPLRDDFIGAKWADDFGAPAIEQAALANFIGNGGFERHLRRSVRAVEARRSVLLQGLRDCSRGRLEIADSRAGMHIVVWLTGRRKAEGDAFVAHALTRGLALHPISPSYYIDPPDRAGLLMGFAAMSALEIEEGVAAFARCLDEMFPVGPRRSQRTPRAAVAETQDA